MENLGNALVTIGIGPWDIELGLLAWVVIPLIIAIVLFYALKD